MWSHSFYFYCFVIIRQGWYVHKEPYFWQINGSLFGQFKVDLQRLRKKDLSHKSKWETHLEWAFNNFGFWQKCNQNIFQWFVKKEVWSTKYIWWLKSKRYQPQLKLRALLEIKIKMTSFQKRKEKRKEGKEGRKKINSIE